VAVGRREKAESPSGDGDGDQDKPRPQVLETRNEVTLVGLFLPLRRSGRCRAATSSRRGGWSWTGPLGAVRPHPARGWSRSTPWTAWPGGRGAADGPRAGTR